MHKAVACLFSDSVWAVESRMQYTSGIIVKFSIMIWTMLIYNCCMFWEVLSEEKFLMVMGKKGFVPVLCSGSTQMSKPSIVCQLFLSFLFLFFFLNMFERDVSKREVTCRFYTMNWMCFYYRRKFLCLDYTLIITFGWIFASFGISKPYYMYFHYLSIIFYCSVSYRICSTYSAWNNWILSCLGLLRADSFCNSS